MGVQRLADVWGRSRVFQEWRGDRARASSVGEDELGRELARVGERFHLFVDFRVLHDPDAGSLQSHIGSHPVIMRRACEHMFFSRCTQAVARGLLEHRASTPFRIACVCRSGCHRSVAVAHLLARALHALGYSCSTQLWSDRYLRNKQCQRDGPCPDCDGSGDRREAVCRMAAA